MAELVQSILKAHRRSKGWTDPSVSRGGSYTFQSPQLIPFLPSNIAYALESLATGGLFSDGGESFLQNL